MNILYTCDNNYVWLMGISMVSLFKNNKNSDKIKVYLIGENISIENKKHLEDIAYKYGRECIIINTPKLNIPDALCSQRWPLSAFSRLYAGVLLPKDVHRIIYLDCDTIVNGDINELYNYNNQDFAISGVKDCISKQYRKNIGINDDDIYINAGVLLMDLSKLRTIDVSNFIALFLKKYALFINYADQDVLNGIFRGKFGVLPLKYNIMTLSANYGYKDINRIRKPSNYYTENEFIKATNDPKIIHYTTCMLTIRPWIKKSNHPFANQFTKYKELSPWKDKELLNFTKNSSNKNKILNIIFRFIPVVRNLLIGLIHAKLLPRFIYIKAKRISKKEGYKI